MEAGRVGEPLWHAAEYGEVVRRARELSIRAVERLAELMESEDERVAAVASNAILDRAFGKAREQTPKENEYASLSREELNHRLEDALRKKGVPEEAIRLVVDGPTDRIRQPRGHVRSGTA